MELALWIDMKVSEGRDMNELQNNPGVNQARLLLARLVAAMLVADGRVTEAEIEAVGRLDGLGLGPLSAAVEEELQRAARLPIDAEHAAETLMELAPSASEVVFSALAAIAACDGISAKEIAILGVVADRFGLGIAAATDMIRAAAAGFSPSTQAAKAGAEAESIASVPEAATAPPPAEAGRRENPGASPADVLGVGEAASLEALDAAYAAMVRRYDPVAVIDLGPEFAVLAVRRLEQATEAYLASRRRLGARTAGS